MIGLSSHLVEDDHQVADVVTISIQTIRVRPPGHWHVSSIGQVLCGCQLHLHVVYNDDELGNTGSNAIDG